MYPCFSQELQKISDEHNLGPGIWTKIQLAVISAIFDYTNKMGTAMKSDYWEKCMPAIEKLLEVMKENQDKMTIGENYTDEQEALEEAPFMVSEAKELPVFVEILLEN